MNADEAAQIVKTRQDAFMRDEMPDCEVEYLKKEYPNAIPDWLRMKANLLVRLNKFRKQLKSMYLAACQKTLRKKCGVAQTTKQNRAVAKLGRKYNRSGCNVLVKWHQLIAEVENSILCL